jgi:hypothetical protein
MGIVFMFGLMIVLMCCAIALGAVAMPLLGLAFALLLIPICLFSFVFWIWMLIDAIKNENISANERVAWVVAIGLTHWLGALIYFFAARSRRRVSLQAPPLARA